LAGLFRPLNHGRRANQKVSWFCLRPCRTTEQASQKEGSSTIYEHHYRRNDTITCSPSRKELADFKNDIIFSL